MRYTNLRGVSADDGEGDDASTLALPIELPESDPTHRGGRSDATRGRAWAAGVARWGEELRASLRGRRLFTLFAVVNLVNYLDRGVS